MGRNSAMTNKIAPAPTPEEWQSFAERGENVDVLNLGGHAGLERLRAKIEALLPPEST